MGNLWAGLGKKLVELVLPSLATMVAGLAVASLQKVLKKQGLELTQAQEQRLRVLAEDAILQVEEMARRQQGQMTSEQKAEEATRIVAARAPEVSRNAIKAAIDSVLPIVRQTLGQSLRQN